MERLFEQAKATYDLIVIDTLGVIANGFKSGGRGSYGYAYDYSCSPQPPSSSPPAPDVPLANGARALAGERSVPSVDG